MSIICRLGPNFRTKDVESRINDTATKSLFLIVLGKSLSVYNVSKFLNVKIKLLLEIRVKRIICNC